MCEVDSYWGIAIALWAIVEFWLGKTELVKAGSTLEVFINIIKSFLGAKSP